MGIEDFPKIETTDDIKKEADHERQEDLPDFKFEVTAHSIRKDFKPEEFRKECKKINSQGINSIRMDYDMNLWEKEGGSFSVRYQEAKKIMEESGLETPTIVMSNPSEESIKTYQENKKVFFDQFKKYAEETKAMLNQAGGKRVERIQILNELNNKVFTKINPEDIPELVKIARETFADYNPDIKFLCTLNVNNLAGVVGTGAKKYISEWKETLDNFDIVGLDYYPGTWHFPGVSKKILQEKHLPTPKQFFKEWVKNVDLLKEVSEEIASWGKDYEMDEVGMSSRGLWGGEKGQRYFYDSFMRAYKHMLNDFSRRGIKLPDRLGFYQMTDENEPIGKFGLMTETGENKMITQRVKKLKSYIKSKQEKN